jgi:hypothetical protein
VADRFSFYGGIDFSGAREPLSNLWTAVATEEDGELVILELRPHAYRADLCSYLQGAWRGAVGADPEAAVLWGADFPFGLPAEVGERLLGAPHGWRSLLAWVADRPADEIRDLVADAVRTPRLTDTGGALSPLDLRLYKQTVEGLRWLHELLESGEAGIHPQAPDPAAGTALVEVYPSATVQELGLPRRRAPSRPGEIRARAAALRTFLRFAEPNCEAIAVTLEDAWDATIACLTAWLVREDLDQPFRTSAYPRAALELEGWIYRPPAALAPAAGPTSGPRRRRR